MFRKYFLKSLSLILIFSLVYAEKRDDCKKLGYNEGNCSTNNEGEIIILRTLENISSNYDKLTNLEELYINAGTEGEGNNEYTPTIANEIKKNILPNLKSLKKLHLAYVKISKTTTKEISSLSNLEELYLEECTSLDVLTPEYTEKLKNLTTLTIEYCKGMFCKTGYLKRKFISGFKYLKKLTLYAVIINQDNFNEICSLSNLVELKTDITNVKMDSFKNLNNLTDLTLSYYDKNMIDDENYDSYDADKKKLKLKLPKNIKKLYFDATPTQDNIDEINKLSKLEEFYIEGEVDKKLNFDSLKNNSKLWSFGIITNGARYHKNVNTLGEIPDFIYLLTSLKKLVINGNKIKTASSKLKNLTNLKYLDLKDNSFKSIPDSITKLKGLTYLNLYYNEIEDIPDQFKNLVNLEYLDLSNNALKQIPSFLNNLSHLKHINLDSNNDLQGKILTNEKLEVCEYPDNDNICKPIENIPCLQSRNGYYKLCEKDETNITTTTTKTRTRTRITTTTKTRTSTNGSKPTNNDTKYRCGKEYSNAKCSSGQCCSKYGYCGTSSDHCSVSKGCQLEFGKCN